MYLLGISAFYHDSAACIIKDGEILAAVQEERFTRKKHDASFPSNSIAYCLKEAGITPSQVDFMVFYDKPFLKFERLLETYLAFAPRGFISFLNSMPIWLTEKLFQKRVLIKKFKEIWGDDQKIDSRLLFCEHHISHAASAFFPSPFESAAIITLDGVGEWATTTLAIGRGCSLEMQKEITYPHSLGLLYSAMTYYAGFKVNSGEYKLMGLAPYGEPKYADTIKSHLIDIKDDGSFSLNMKYFNYCTGLTMTNASFNSLFGGKPRKPETEITQKEMNIAASIQVVTEEILIKLAKYAAKQTGQKNLCMAGGVALNCVANGKLLREKIFENIWVQPAAGDAGGAIGAALAGYHMMLKYPRKINDSIDKMKGSYLGPSFSQDEIERCLRQYNGVFSVHEDSELIEIVANEIANGKVVGWMNGRMEFGPRSLGARSILADPRSLDMQKNLNLKIKYRESFRPFAPSIMEEQVSDWFEIECKSPYMLFVANIVKNKRINLSDEELALSGIKKLNTIRSSIPSVTHIDYSARIQTVNSKTNPKFYKLIKKFNEITGCPILINTSFNVRGEPIVCNVEDAYRCFMGTDMDILVIGSAYLRKNAQPIENKTHYENEYELD